MLYVHGNIIKKIYYIIENNKLKHDFYKDTQDNIIIQKVKSWVKILLIFTRNTSYASFYEKN